VRKKRNAPKRTSKSNNGGTRKIYGHLRRRDGDGGRFGDGVSVIVDTGGDVVAHVSVIVAHKHFTAGYDVDASGLLL